MCKTLGYALNIASVHMGLTFYSKSTYITGFGSFGLFWQYLAQCFEREKFRLEREISAVFN